MWKKKRDLLFSSVILSLTLVLFTGFQSPVSLSQLPKAKVVAIKDGDTIEILTSDKFSIIIRLDEIDCPEKKQAFGERARQFTADFCFGKYVRIRSRGRDGFGRLLGEVYNEQGVSLNRSLVRNGYAWRFDQYSKSADLSKLQTEARMARRGLWADPKPVSPWEFRKLRSGRNTVLKKAS